MGAPALGSVLGGSLAGDFGATTTSFAYAIACLGMIALLVVRHLARRAAA